MANEIGNFRMYGQIHYSKSYEDGQVQGRKAEDNIFNKVKFLKGLIAEQTFTAGSQYLPLNTNKLVAGNLS